MNQAIVNLFRLTMDRKLSATSMQAIEYVRETANTECM